MEGDGFYLAPGKNLWGKNSPSSDLSRIPQPKFANVRIGIEMEMGCVNKRAYSRKTDRNKGTGNAQFF